MSEYKTTKFSKPVRDGLYVVLKKGFTYDMGNKDNLVPEIAYYNGGRGCFNEDYDNSQYLYWTKIPYFKEPKGE